MRMLSSFTIRSLLTAPFILDLLLGGPLHSALMTETQTNSGTAELPVSFDTGIQPQCDVFLPSFTPAYCADTLTFDDRKEKFLKLLAQQLEPLEQEIDGQILFKQTTSPGCLYHLIGDFAPGSGWLKDPHAMFEKLKTDSRTKDRLPIDNYPTLFSSSQIMLAAEVLAEMPITNTNFTKFHSHDSNPERTKNNIACLNALYTGEEGTSTLQAHLEQDTARLQADAKHTAEFIAAAKLVYRS